MVMDPSEHFMRTGELLAQAGPHTEVGRPTAEVIARAQVEATLSVAAMLGAILVELREKKK